MRNVKIKKNRRPGKLKKASPRTGKPASKKPSAVWDQAAQWYDALVGLKGSEYQKAIIFPGALQLMQLEKGDAVLDLACGQGVFSRYLSQRKIKVTGLDTSEEMIRFAQSRSDPSIRFEHADAQDSQALQGKTFDAVVCLLALQNIESLPPVMRNVKRWLKPGGRFVMVTTHPCFRIPRQTHWRRTSRRTAPAPRPRPPLRKSSARCAPRYWRGCARSPPPPLRPAPRG